jgi:hypothetical protein
MISAGWAELAQSAGPRWTHATVACAQKARVLATLAAGFVTQMANSGFERTTFAFAIVAAQA